MQVDQNEFEVLYCNPRGISIEKYPNGTYKSDDASDAWTVWQMAHAAGQQEKPGFELTAVQTTALLKMTLKPEEISGSVEVQHQRVHELVRWFLRLAQDNANPKWERAHAFELAYYIATNGTSRHVDLSAVRNASFRDGLNCSLSDRRVLEKLGVAQQELIPKPVVWVDDEGVPHGRVSDEQLVAALQNAIVQIEQRNNWSSHESKEQP